MIEIVVRVALAGVLGEAALATFGFGEGPLRWVAWAGLIALELGLAIAVAAGVDGAAYGAAALTAMFAALIGSALMQGRAGAPCACFGSRSRVSPVAIARNLALAAAFGSIGSLA